MRVMFENLDVYRKSVDFTEQITVLVETFPKGNYYLVDQLNRAALSIPTNIAEGNGRFHKAERLQFFRIARGSAFECVPILEICQRKKLISTEVHEDLLNKIENISKMLSGLMRG